MPSEDPDPRLERLLAAVVSALNPRAVYLFGSRAEGRARPDSDDDLMVVLPDDCDEDHLDPLLVYEIGNQAQVPADIMPVSPEDFLKYRGALYSCPGWFTHEGGCFTAIRSNPSGTTDISGPSTCHHTAVS